MGSRARNLAIGLALAICSLPPYAFSKTAIVFSGKNINTALFLGMYDAAIDAGKKPDIVIGSCGGAIGAALVHVEKRREARIRFLQSPEYYAIVKNVVPSEQGIFHFLSSVMAIERQAARLNRNGSPKRLVIKDWFSYSLVNRGTEFARIPLFNQPFSETGVPTIIVASRALVPAPVQNTLVDAETKLFREVFFTDSVIARRLLGLPSFSGRTYSKSAVDSVTETVVPSSIIQAVMASGSDPVYFGPTVIGNASYFTGALNLHAINVANALADEVIATYPSEYEESFEEPLVQATFGFDPNSYNRRVVELGADYWIDFTDAAFANFSPRGFLNLSNAAKTFSPRDILIFKSGVPDHLSDYQAQVLAQYRHAYERTNEAFLQSRRSLHHIRKPIQ